MKGSATFFAGGVNLWSASRVIQGMETTQSARDFDLEGKLTQALRREPLPVPAAMDAAIRQAARARLAGARTAESHHVGGLVFGAAALALAAVVTVVALECRPTPRSLPPPAIVVAVGIGLL